MSCGRDTVSSSLSSWSGGGADKEEALGLRTSKEVSVFLGLSIEGTGIAGGVGFGGTYYAEEGKNLKTEVKGERYLVVEAVMEILSCYTFRFFAFLRGQLCGVVRLYLGKPADVGSKTIDKSLSKFFGICVFGIFLCSLDDLEQKGEDHCVVSNGWSLPETVYRRCIRGRILFQMLYEAVEESGG